MGLGDAVDKVVASALPGGLGGLYELYMGAPAKRREEAWKEYIHDTVVGLARWHDNLTDDEIFHDAVYHSTRIALGTHQEEKLEALRNALGNSVGPGGTGRRRAGAVLPLRGRTITRTHPSASVPR